MAKGITFTVTHPDGSTSTRTSKSMTYTHAIVCHTTHDDAVTEVAGHLAHAERRLDDIVDPREGVTYGPTAEKRARKDVADIQARLDSIGPDGEYGAIAWSQSAHNAQKTADHWTAVTARNDHMHGTYTVEQVDDSALTAPTTVGDDVNVTA